MFDKARYAENWDEIAGNMKLIMGWRCEVCGTIHDPENGYCLTVHHLNGVRKDNRFENLLVCCQRCHLRLQGKYAPGQMFILKNLVPEWINRRGIM